MAHKKGGGSTKNGRDSNPKYLGLKAAGGSTVAAGTIILRPREAPSSSRASMLGLDATIPYLPFRMA